MTQERHNDEYAQLEGELERALRDGFGVERADLSLSAEEQERSDRYAEEALARITETVPFDAADRRRHPWWWAWGGAAAAAAVAVGAAVIPFGASPPQAYAATPPLIEIAGTAPSDYPLAGHDADAELSALASHAAEQSSTASPGLIQRVEASGWWLDTERLSDGVQSQLVPVEVQRFRLPDGNVRIREERGAPLTDDGDLVPGSGEPAVVDETFPTEAGNPLEHPERLPTRPAALRRVLLGQDPAECRDIEGYCLTQAIRSLNQNFVLRPDLQASLIRTLLGAADIAYAGPGRDRVGRGVEVFVVTDPDQVHQYLILFDQSSGAFVGDETVLIRNTPDLEVAAPAVIEFNAITDRALITDADLPTAPSSPSS